MHGSERDPYGNPVVPSLADYLSLVPPQHRNKPNFIAALTAVLQPMVDHQAVLASMPAAFDLDVAVGVQLDQIGLWVGVSRKALSLDDTTYRLLLRARIEADRWDGTLSGAIRAFDYLFSDPATHVFIQDNLDMSYYLNVSGTLLSPSMMAVLTGGYIPLKPAGVRLAGVNVVSVDGLPLFGFDIEDPAISGFDVGAWALTTY